MLACGHFKSLTAGWVGRCLHKAHFRREVAVGKLASTLFSQLGHFHRRSWWVSCFTTCRNAIPHPAVGNSTRYPGSRGKVGGPKKNESAGLCIISLVGLQVEMEARDLFHLDIFVSAGSSQWYALVGT